MPAALPNARNCTVLEGRAVMPYGRNATAKVCPQGALRHIEPRQREERQRKDGREVRCHV